MGQGLFTATGNLKRDYRVAAGASMTTALQFHKQMINKEKKKISRKSVTICLGAGGVG
jgi:hypothetical protein